MKTFRQLYQESFDEIHPDRGLLEDMLEDARTEKARWIQYALLRPVATFLLGAILLFGCTSALASNVGFVYGIIERMSPELADLFVPVSESSTRAGICMEVEAVYLEDGDKSARVLISFRDTLAERIQGPLDLYDSYGMTSVNSLDASWVTGGCSYAGYDEETGKAYFEIQLSSDVPYERSKLTFRVRQLLLRQEREEKEISLEDHVPGMPEKPVSLSGGGRADWGRYQELTGLEMEEPGQGLGENSIRNPENMPDDPRPAVKVLDGIPVSECAADDFTVTGLVYRDNLIRLQICQGEFARSFRYVIPYLKLPDGSERIYWYSNFWQEKQGDESLAFSEFYLPCTPEELEGASLWGEFYRMEDSVEGNWKVTFRVEEKKEPDAVPN